MDFAAYSPEEIQVFLESQVPYLSKDVLGKIVEHKIDGKVFLTLSDDHFREIAPLLGDRLKMKCLQSSLLNDASTVSVYKNIVSV